MLSLSPRVGGTWVAQLKLINNMKKYLIGIIGLMLAGLGGVAYANPSSLLPASYGIGTVTGSSATTSFSWVTPGTGTTTATATNCAQASFKCDKALVVYQITATNTPQNSKLDYRVEYSLDNTTWYSSTVASSSVTIAGVMAQEYAINVATSTAYQNQDSILRLTGAFAIDTWAPYNRVVFFSPIGGANFSLYAAIVPMKEVAL